MNKAAPKAAPKAKQNAKPKGKAEAEKSIRSFKSGVNGPRGPYHRDAEGEPESIAPSKAKSLLRSCTCAACMA